MNFEFLKLSVGCAVILLVTAVCCARTLVRLRGRTCYGFCCCTCFSKIAAAEGAISARGHSEWERKIHEVFGSVAPIGAIAGPSRSGTFPQNRGNAARRRDANWSLV